MIRSFTYSRKSAHKLISMPGGQHSREEGAPLVEIRSDGALPTGAGRRYVGRAGSRATGLRLPPSERGRAVAAPTARAEPAGYQQAGAIEQAGGALRLAWSARLAIAVILLLAAGGAARLLGLATLPLDPPAGIEASYAAAARSLAEGSPPPGEGVRPLLVPLPWQGPLPVNLNAGLPIYLWIYSALLALGAGDWAGRLLTLASSLVAGLATFGIVRALAGTRAALYALLLFLLSPLSVVQGQAVSPAFTALLFQAVALLLLLRWASTVHPERLGGSNAAFGLALAFAALAAVVSPGSILLLFPAGYIILSATTTSETHAATASRASGLRLATLWSGSADRGRASLYALCLLSSAVAWWLYAGAGAQNHDSSDGLGPAVGALFNPGTYGALVGLSIEKVLGLLGLLLLGAGLLHGARSPFSLLFHVWLGAGVLTVLSQAGSLGKHDEVLLPLLLPLAALVGTGASWVSALPTRIWLALREQQRDSASDYVITPHTAWLLDLPEQSVTSTKASRPQAQLALGRTIAARSRSTGTAIRQYGLLGTGHLVVLAALVVVVGGPWQHTAQALQPTPLALEVAGVAGQVAGKVAPGDTVVVVGPNAEAILYGSSRTGWVVPKESFNLTALQVLQASGASYLLTMDQEWLGRQPDYRGLLTNYSVGGLASNYILFDLNKKAIERDRLYFLESGHTLGGAFRRFWEERGGVAKLGYPISEEIVLANPLDGQERTVQFFERAVLEYHPEHEGTPDAVMLATVGRWVTQGKELPRVAPFTSTSDRAYFPQTGHSVREAFLRYWHREGGVSLFGYPISEELPEINPADGKVYTVQYFERARFEWHPTFAGTPDEVQLGLIGKQALEMIR